MTKRSKIFAAGIILNGIYEVLGLIERSNNVLTYVAKEIETGRERALKVLHTNATAPDIAALMRHQNEARCLARLSSHPNIIRVYDYKVSESGEPYMVTEYLEKRKLSSLLAESRVLSYHRAFPIFAQICDAMKYAHNHSVVKRELSPDCVFLVRNNKGEDVVKISNFSSALQLDFDHRPLPLAFDLAANSPCYISPELLMEELSKQYLYSAEEEKIPAEIAQEYSYMLQNPELLHAEIFKYAALFPQSIEKKTKQHRDTSISHLSDVFSMGSLMYTTLIGTAPFALAEIKQALEENIFMTPPRFELLRPDLQLPFDLQKVIRKALERDPSDRYEDMDKLRNALLFTPGQQSIADAQVLFNSVYTFILGEGGNS